MRRALVAYAAFAIAAPAFAASGIFIGTLGKTSIDLAINDRDPDHVVGATLRPRSEVTSFIPRMTTLRLLTGTRERDRFTLQEWDAAGHQTATIVARLKQNFYLDGTWTPTGGRAQRLSSWVDSQHQSAFADSTSASTPALERLHDDIRGGRWSAAEFDARLACAIADRECVWIDALSALAAGREPPHAAYEPWRGLVFERAGAKEEAIKAGRQLCESRSPIACRFWIDVQPERETLRAACRQAFVACDRYWGTNEITLIDAAWRADAAEVARLLARGTSPDVGGEARLLTPLQAAVIKGSMPAVKLLIEHGADPNRHGDALSALFHAISAKHDDMALFLIDHGAKIDNGYHEDILWHAAYYNLRKTVHAILEGGVDPNGGTVPAGSPLTAAVDNRNRAMVADLLAHGADPDYSNKHSEGSPIDHARRTHQTEILRMLLAARKKSE